MDNLSETLNSFIEEFLHCLALCIKIENCVDFELQNDNINNKHLHDFNECFKNFNFKGL